MTANGTSSMPRLIAVDWGTSRLRAWLVDAHGAPIATAASDEGIGTLNGGHEAVFERLVADWPKLPAIAAASAASDARVPLPCAQMKPTSSAATWPRVSAMRMADAMPEPSGRGAVA